MPQLTASIASSLSLLISLISEDDILDLDGHTLGIEPFDHLLHLVDKFEITKIVYQHPRYVSSAPHASFGRLGVVFISPTEKIAVGDEILLFCY